MFGRSRQHCGRRYWPHHADHHHRDLPRCRHFRRTPLTLPPHRPHSTLDRWRPMRHGLGAGRSLISVKQNRDPHGCLPAATALPAISHMSGGNGRDRVPAYLPPKTASQHPECQEPVPSPGGEGSLHQGQGRVPAVPPPTQPRRGRRLQCGRDCPPLGATPPGPEGSHSCPVNPPHPSPGAANLRPGPHRTVPRSILPRDTGRPPASGPLCR